MKKSAKKLTKRTKRILRKARKHADASYHGIAFGVDKHPFTATVQHCSGAGPIVPVHDPLWHWKTKDGTVLRIVDMGLSHLINAHSLLGRRIMRARALAANMKAVIKSKMREEGHDSNFDYEDETY